jgi:hypothetical protein
MSYCEIFIVPGNGELCSGKEFGNAHRGAGIIWSKIGQRHLGWQGHEMFKEQEARRLWELARRPDVPLRDRVALACTFDNAMLRLEDVPWFCGQMDDFIAAYDLEQYHPRAWVSYLRSVHRNEPAGIFGFCWNHTSLNADAWMVEDHEIEDEDEGYRMFDVARDGIDSLLFLCPERFSWGPERQGVLW